MKKRITCAAAAAALAFVLAMLLPAAAVTAEANAPAAAAKTPVEEAAALPAAAVTAEANATAAAAKTPVEEAAALPAAAVTAGAKAPAAETAYHGSDALNGLADGLSLSAAQAAKLHANTPAAHAVDPGKTGNMSVFYGLLAVISLILAVGCAFVNRNQKKFLLLYSCVFAANSGYFLLSVSDTLAGALMANRLSYLGAAYAVLLMLLIIIEVCGLKLRRGISALLVCVTTGAFLVAASGGISRLYYSAVAIEKVNGVTVLVKEYGPLHGVYCGYLGLYFALMVGVTVYAACRRTVAVPHYAYFLASIVLGNIAVWLVEQFIDSDFEFLSVSYIATELLLLLLYGMLNKFDLLLTEGDPSEQAEPPKADDIGLMLDDFAQKIKTLSAAEARILDYYVQGREIAEVPELAYISINTVKKHNRSIYGKLGVASRDDLMLYIELFRRCGRLEELTAPAGGGTPSCVRRA